jgi:BASS family bile acid:Na+ symporter
MDLVQIFYTQVIPVGLWVVMLGMGLSLTPKDIKNCFVMPKAITIGLLGQLVGLPALAFILALFFAPTPAIAVGVIILAACPGGVTSNAYSFASRADVALSVSLTAVTSFITIFTIPLLTYLAVRTFLDADTYPELPVLQMMYTLATLTVIPVAIGMGIRQIWSERARLLIEALRTATFLFLVLLVLAGTVVAFDVLKQYFLQTAMVAVSLNVISMAMGFGLGWLFKLGVPQRVSITYEIGVQNISLASLVALSLLGNEEFFVVTLVYAAIMKITALSFMYFAKKWIVRDELKDQGLNLVLSESAA